MLLVGILVAACGVPSGDVQSRTAVPATTSSVYPADWVEGICRAYEQFERGSPERTYGLVTRALGSLALTPPWEPGNEARDQLIEYFKLLERRVLDRSSPPASGSPDAAALAAALEEAKGALRHVEATTREPLECPPPLPRPS